MTDEGVGAPGGPESDETGEGGRAPEEDQGTAKGSPHTSPEEGHPAGGGERSERDVGGPTSPEDPEEETAGGGPSPRPDGGFEPHRDADE